jgi:histidinol-phosphate aminotransferase
MNVNYILRPHLRTLKPYSSARSEFIGTASVYIDANENPYDWAYNRYPDPLQVKLKDELSQYRKVSPSQIFCGNGSDEAIDLLIRAFCEPKVDTILSINPSYGMYQVSADINDVKVRYFGLKTDFTLDVEAFIAYVEPQDKLIFLCSPNNPTGLIIPLLEIEKVLQAYPEKLIVVDEAYIDFSESVSALSLLNHYHNLVVLQTLSKAQGCAGLRIGTAYAHTDIIDILNKIKPPYNISGIAQDQALTILINKNKWQAEIREIIDQRRLLTSKLRDIPYIEMVYDSHANFILIKVPDANRLYLYLLDNGIVSRSRDSHYNCKGCIRLTVGTPLENQTLIQTLTQFAP